MHLAILVVTVVKHLILQLLLKISQLPISLAQLLKDLVAFQLDQVDPPVMGRRVLVLPDRTNQAMVQVDKIA